MRMMFKLFALAVLGVFFQIAIESTAAVANFPSDSINSDFGEDESRAVVTAQQRFNGSTLFARWFVIDVLQMPYLRASEL